MRNYIILLSGFVLFGCSVDIVDVSSYKETNLNQLNGIALGGRVEDIKKKFKGDIIIQNYKDINFSKECESSINIIVDDNQTNIDVNSSGIITAINTTNKNVTDGNGVQIGQNETYLLNLNPIAKEKKASGSDEGGHSYEYKIAPTDSHFYYIYNVDVKGKVDYIGLFSKDHIECYED